MVVDAVQSEPVSAKVAGKTGHFRCFWPDLPVFHGFWCFGSALLSEFSDIVPRFPWFSRIQGTLENTPETRVKHVIYRVGGLEIRSKSGSVHAVDSAASHNMTPIGVDLSRREY